MTDPSAYEVAVRHVDKPWGYEIHFALTESYCGKVLFVRAGESLSLQYHELKDETIYLQSGLAELTLGTPGGELAVETIASGRAFRLPPGTVHRLVAIEDSTFLETSTPQLDDVVRLEDRYGRSGLGQTPPR
jgi:quercetin dioxygenase-like cupin family protein